MPLTIELGNKAEQFVADHLKKEGFTITARNYKKKCGEIDIIASKSDLLVFVEVKMRSALYFDPAELITMSKQRKIINVAYQYISEHKSNDKICRFDVALVTLQGNRLEMTYIPHAFGEQ